MKPPEWKLKEQLKHSLLNWSESSEYNTGNALLVRYSNIPDYLREGYFFQSLNSEEPYCEISIPSECYAVNDCVNDLIDFTLLLKVTAYWGLHKVPPGVIAYCHQQNLSPTEMWKKLIESDFTAVDFAQELASIFECSDPLSRAIELGRTDVVELLVDRDESKTTEPITTASLHGCPWNNILLLEAAEHNHLHCIIYVHKQGMVWHKDLSDELAIQGNIEGLKYVIVNGGFVFETTLECAVRNMVVR